MRELNPEVFDKLKSLTEEVRVLEARLGETHEPFGLSDEIEMRISEFVERLVSLNDSLTNEVEERKRIEEQLTKVIKERDQLISNLVKTQEALEYQASHDGLTCLLNNTSIIDILKKEIDRASRTNSEVGIVLCDIDNFKEINDTGGHLAGDEILRRISDNLMSFVRSYDSVGRYGGDEFLILLPGCGLKDALHLAERIGSSFSAAPITTEEGEFKITLSIGVTSVRGSSDQDIKVVIRSVDHALYDAKRMGKNCVVAHSFDSETSEVPISVARR